jgi:hypothetical protein
MDAPTGVTLNSSSDLGSFNNDKKTADDTPTINVSGLAVGATVTLTATPTSGSPTVCTFIATSGSGSCTFTSLGNSTYSIVASQTLNGITTNNSTALTDVMINKATISPTVTIDLDATSDTGASSTDNITSSTQLKIVASSSSGVSYTTSYGSSGSSSPCDAGCNFGVSAGVITFYGPINTDLYGNTARSTLVVTVDGTAPTLTLAAAAATSPSGTINFTLTGNEALSCSSISATNGVDFDFTNISAITGIVQTSPTVCTITATSSATDDAVATTSTLTRASTFSVTDTAGSAQTAVTGSPKSTSR